MLAKLVRGKGNGRLPRAAPKTCNIWSSLSTRGEEKTWGSLPQDENILRECVNKPLDDKWVMGRINSAIMKCLIICGSNFWNKKLWQIFLHTKSLIWNLDCTKKTLRRIQREMSYFLPTLQCLASHGTMGLHEVWACRQVTFGPATIRKLFIGKSVYIGRWSEGLAHFPTKIFFSQLIYQRYFSSDFLLHNWGPQV